jgi:hypothetical protein
LNRIGPPHDSDDVLHLRELAGKCRQVAAGLTDQKDIQALRQMASEYEAMADKIERAPMPNPQTPTRS